MDDTYYYIALFLCAAIGVQTSLPPISTQTAVAASLAISLLYAAIFRDLIVLLMITPYVLLLAVNYIYNIKN